MAIESAEGKQIVQIGIGYFDVRRPLVEGIADILDVKLDLGVLPEAEPGSAGVTSTSRTRDPLPERSGVIDQRFNIAQAVREFGQRNPPIRLHGSGVLQPQAQRRANFPATRQLHACEAETGRSPEPVIQPAIAVVIVWLAFFVSIGRREMQSHIGPDVFNEEPIERGEPADGGAFDDAVRGFGLSRIGQENPERERGGAAIGRFDLEGCTAGRGVGQFEPRQVRVECNAYVVAGLNLNGGDHIAESGQAVQRNPVPAAVAQADIKFEAVAGVAGSQAEFAGGRVARRRRNGKRACILRREGEPCTQRSDGDPAIEIGIGIDGGLNVPDQIVKEAVGEGASLGDRYGCRLAPIERNAESGVAGQAAETEAPDPSRT